MLRDQSYSRAENMHIRYIHMHIHIIKDWVIWYCDLGVMTSILSCTVWFHWLRSSFEFTGSGSGHYFPHSTISDPSAFMSSVFQGPLSVVGLVPWLCIMEGSNAKQSLSKNIHAGTTEEGAHFQQRLLCLSHDIKAPAMEGRIQCTTSETTQLPQLVSVAYWGHTVW